jgi:hypothetical protein
MLKRLILQPREAFSTWQSTGFSHFLWIVPQGVAVYCVDKVFTGTTALKEPC